MIARRRVISYSIFFYSKIEFLAKFRFGHDFEIKKILRIRFYCTGVTAAKDLGFLVKIQYG
mgnify:CR=1 FL=1